MLDWIRRGDIDPESIIVSKSFIRRVLLASSIALLLLISSFVSNSTASQAATNHILSSYSCYSNHCHGIADWSDNGTYPLINGAYTAISMVHIACSAPSCQSSRGDFIDDEIWVRDATHQASSCPTYKVGCWVEQGYIATANSSGSGTTVNYFWADYRPGDSMLNFHYIAVVPSGDYGYATFFDIYRTASSNCSTSPRSGTFAVNIASETQFYNNTSARDCQTPDDINIGQELAGTSGASAPTANFTDNEWVGTNGVANYQTLNADTPSPNAPVSDSWVTLPSHSSTGGDFTTKCGC